MSGPPVTRSGAITVPVVPGFSSYAVQLSGVPQSSAHVELIWASSENLQVEVFASGTCPHGGNLCPNGPPLVSWWSNSGTWSVTGPAAFPLILNLTNPNATSASFSGTFLESYSAGGWTNLTWLQLLPLTGGVVLLVIGGLAVFLGLFLRSGVYQRAPGVGPIVDLDEEDDEFEEPVDLDGAPDDEDPIDKGPT